MGDIKETKNDLILSIKARKRPRFKAGAELSSTVNLVAVEVDEETTEDSNTLFLSVHLQRTAQLTIEATQ